MRAFFLREELLISQAMETWNILRMKPVEGQYDKAFICGRHRLTMINNPCCSDLWIRTHLSPCEGSCFHPTA